MQEAILSLNARGRAKGHILAFLTVFVWGITFVSTKVLLAAVTPIEILFLRFSLGFLALCVIHRRVTPFMGARVEALFALAGATGVTLYFLMENIALTMTSASNVGVIVAIAPLFIALISFAGAAAGDAGLAGCLLAVLAALAWAVYSTIGKRIAKLGLSTVATTKRTFAWGLVFMLPFLPVMGFGQGAEGAGLAGLLDPVMLGNLLFLGLVASATCYVMWNKAASIVGVVNVSAYLYLTPVVTVVASVIVLAEPLTWKIALGVALTVTGLILSER